MTEPHVITGVVGPRGATCSKWGADVDWTMRFELRAWKDAVGLLHAELLSVSRKIPDDEEELPSRIKAFSLVAVRVTRPVDGVAELIDLLRTDVVDEELAAVSLELQKPIVHQDVKLGTLVLDRELDWFDTKAQWGARMISLTIGAVDDQPPKVALEAALALFDESSAWERRVRGYAADELLALKNESWLDEDEHPVSRDQFLDRLKLESIGVDEDGGFEFGFDDGDLFWDHEILVSGDLNSGPTSASISG